MNFRICLFLFLLSVTISKAQETKNEISVTLHPEVQFQTIDHFGASDAWSAQFVGNWPEAKKEAIANLLFSQEMKQGNPEGIGLSMWRFNLGAGSAEQGETSGIKDEWRRAESFLGNKGELDMSKAERQVWFAEAAKNRGVEKLLLFSNSPPIQFTKNSKAYSSDGRSNLKTDAIDDFSDYLSDVVSGLQKMGLNPGYVSPVNEPQWDWSDGGQEGNPYTNEQIAELVKGINTSFQEHDIKVKIDVAEAGKINYLFEKADKPQRGTQVKSFFDQKSPTYLGDLSNLSNVISAHSYFTTSPLDKSADLRAKVASTVASIPGLNYWMSEYCILGDNEGEIRGNGRDLGMKSALYMARVIHQDLTISNASAWNWWLAISPYNYKDGLIYIDKEKKDGRFFESKMLWVLGNYSRFIRPGYQRIGLDVSNEKLMVSAFQNPDTKDIVLIVLNSNPTSELLKIANSDTKWIKAYITDENSNLAAIEISGSLQEIPKESVMTFLISLD
ncbi:glycoside hydrolase family 30 protein [Algoriphagus machipongonensis]|uniref:Xylanase n=1 Tax=Algoriphagus machipongonensis TaxID=388413 RepID=A3HZM4_9BACT|nr:glycoside hydrolase family 30 protein [Algoriphagus machipongonensis]EAZ80710.1 putative xylanase [Algoriphagus machipongonensis]